MNIIKSIFGRDGKFYDLLEASAGEARSSAALLAKLLPLHGTGDFAKTNADLAQHRREHNKISQDTTELLCKNFVTPMEREDIEALSSALYRITKNVEKIGARLQVIPHQIPFEHFSRQIKMIEEGTAAVEGMVLCLRKRSHVEVMTGNYELLQSIEREADKLIVELLGGLYQSDCDVRIVVILKDLYELFEKVIDRCRDAGNVVFEVVLKYS